MSQIKPGQRVKIVGKRHPWKGHSGVISKTMDTPIGAMWVVALDNGMNAGARNESLQVEVEP